jgi:sialate O-acetylesterase
MNNRICKLLIFCLLTVAYAVEAQEIRLSKLFSNGVVLQGKTSVPVFGLTAPGTTVNVTGSWDGKTVQVTANAAGRFEAYLSTPSASYTSYNLTVNDSVVNNVLIGEVWFASGQSNMQLALSGTNSGSVAGDNNTNLRVFMVPILNATEPKAELDGGLWKYGVISGNMATVSAVSYYFARRLQLELNIPVSIICAARGSTGAEEWTNPAVYNILPADVRAPYVNSDGKFPGCWYNGMIAPVLPYKIAGFIWYQGENNASRMQTYSAVIKAMVTGWREDFKNETLPYYFVQLPSFTPPAADWREFREIQREIAETLPNAGFVTTVDVGDATNIHPTNKKPVGDRLGDMALASVYGKTTTFNSPQFRSASVEGNAMRVFFNFAEKGLKISTGEYPELFEIAGVDGTFYPANARIEGNTVLVWADEVSVPAKVRYFWKDYAVPNLFSTDNFPVTPFRMK